MKAHQANLLGLLLTTTMFAGMAFVFEGVAEHQVTQVLIGFGIIVICGALLLWWEIK